MLVLDEADQMLDLGFIHDLKRIVGLLPQPAPDAVLLGHHAEGHRGTGGALPDQPGQGRSQARRHHRRARRTGVIHVNQSEKPALLQLVLKDQAIDRALVFTRTKHGADRVVRQLGNAGIVAEAIHGNKSQPQRERALAAFKAGTCKVLVATDIAARGIDVSGVSHVINYELPNVPESYVHRIGRTARAGPCRPGHRLLRRRRTPVPARHRKADPPEDHRPRAARRLPRRRRRGAEDRTRRPAGAA